MLCQGLFLLQFCLMAVFVPYLFRGILEKQWHYLEHATARDC